MLKIMRPYFGLIICFIGMYANAEEAKSNSASRPEFNFEKAVQEARTMPHLYSILVSWRGDLQLEEYYNGRGPDSLVNIKSVSKSVLSALVGIAIEQGHISSVNQQIGEYFPEYLDDEVDPRKATITIGNLLTMQSGLESTSSRNYGAWVLSSDWIAFALNQAIEYPPGFRMGYSTGNTHLLSAILTKATGTSVLEFARKNLSAPLDFRLADWPRDPNGIHFGGNDMEMTARQMLAFGELYLNKGKTNGRQIIPENWIDNSLKPHTESTREQGRYYGYGWWLRSMAGHDTAYAWGYGGQYIFLVPDLDLVIVTTSSSYPHNDRRAHRRQLTTILEDHIIKPVADRLTGSSTGLD
jgi:CubicO group peptidase (beta-lactamase class C family)